VSSYNLSPDTAVGVIGAGTMGAGVAQVAAQAGHRVLLYDMQPGAADKALARIAKDLAGAVDRGKLSAEERETVLGRLGAAGTLAELAGCGLAVEAIVERLEPKQELFRQLEALLDPAAVLATNTSSISITAIAQPLAHPGRVVGWHFFNPATRMKLVEIIPGVATDSALLPALHALSRAWGKTSVDAPNAPGFIVNRVARPYYAEGLRLLGERIASAAALDRLMREAGGFAMGPFELMDLIGVEVNLSVTTSVWEATAYDPRFAPSVLQQELARAGRYGRKSGQGFHDYREGATPQPVETVVLAGALPTVHACGSGAKLGLFAALVERLSAAEVNVVIDLNLPRESLEIENCLVVLTDGRTAAERSSAQNIDVILLDLAADFSAAKTLAAAASPQARAALPALAAALQPAGIDLLPLDDVAGLAVMRSVACLANEAADVMTWSGVGAAHIDTAMKLATAYPRGPLEWADAIGPSRVWTVLDNLQRHYGDDRYRRSPRLSRAHFTGGRLSE
jgi:3-hydroxybutyryl-CoA dehydrogenase